MDLQSLSKQMVKVLNTTETAQLEPYETQVVESTAFELPDLSYQAPTVYSLLDSIQPLPAYSAVFGTCDDGVPFLMDLRDPSPGAILILGDPGSGKSRLLRTILTSASLVNTPDKVSYCLITSNDRNFYAVTEKDHCLAAASPYDRAASELIIELSALIEHRRNGRHRGPAVILAIDDLAVFTGERLDYDGFVHLKWLLEEGPKSHVWPVASLNVHQLKMVDKRLLSAFGSLFFSSMQSPRLLEEFAGGYSPSGYSLYPGYQFEFMYAGDWIRFMLPAVVE
jgi:hypothetical protein